MTSIEYPHEIPERGHRFLGNEVRRQRQFPRDEVEAALHQYFEVANRGAASGDWDEWVDLFTEDAVYVEHTFGVMRGREAIRTWVKAATNSQPTDLHIAVDWYVISNDLCVVYSPQQHPAPDGGDPYQFTAIAILCYAGEGQWCYEEDVYHSGEMARVSAARRTAGGHT